MIPEKRYKIALPYAIDREEGDMQLANLTVTAIDFLKNKSKQSFFLMLEGGEIDHTAHINDLGAVIYEVLDFDKNVELAYQFYLKHPDETLIVVTADHETGGLGLGIEYRQSDYQLFKHQKASVNKLSTLIRTLRSQNASWDEVVEIFKEYLSFWVEIPISDKDEMRLKQAYVETFFYQEVKEVETLYAIDDPLAVLAIDILNEIANVGWTTKSHTSHPVPIFAIGVGAEHFSGRMDNIDVPKKLREIMNLK